MFEYHGNAFDQKTLYRFFIQFRRWNRVSEVATNIELARDSLTESLGKRNIAGSKDFNEVYEKLNEAKNSVEEIASYI